MKLVGQKNGDSQFVFVGEDNGGNCMGAKLKRAPMLMFFVTSFKSTEVPL